MWQCSSFSATHAAQLLVEKYRGTREVSGHAVQHDDQQEPWSTTLHYCGGEESREFELLSLAAEKEAGWKYTLSNTSNTSSCLHHLTTRHILKTVILYERPHEAGQHTLIRMLAKWILLGRSCFPTRCRASLAYILCFHYQGKTPVAHAINSTPSGENSNAVDRAC